MKLDNMNNVTEDNLPVSSTVLYEILENPSYPFPCRIFVKFLRKLALKDGIL